MTGYNNSADAIAWLWSPEAVRVRAGELLARAERGDSAHFTIDHERIPAAARYIADVIRESFPDLAIPDHSRWRHFEAGGIDRWSALARQIADASPEEIARSRIDLAVTSVLLDAGAGADWRFDEPATGRALGRSEGLGIASLHLFASGALSGDPSLPLRADAAALKQFDGSTLAAAFQVRPSNPLVGLDGRAALLRRLGAALEASPALFGADRPRIGNLFDHFAAQANDGRLAARDILISLLRGLGAIWPDRMTLDGTDLGDVWRHAAVGAGDATDGLVPLHKLSQWLAYSLLEPLEDAGITVIDLDALTGLAEYRNGGLFIDLGVVCPRSRSLLSAPQDVAAEPIVEWRAITVALLDCIADPVRAELGVTATALPLAKLLEGGTWRAGRKIAAERRAGGPPPLEVVSDGTVM